MLAVRMINRFCILSTLSLPNMLPNTFTPPVMIAFKFQFNETQLRFAGHNKWSKIARKKMAADTQRSTMISRHVTRIRKHVARHGNSEQHPELATLIERGRELQIPKATLERALTLSLAKSFKEQRLVLKAVFGYLVLVTLYGAPASINQSRAELKKIARKYSLTLLQAGNDVSFFLEKGVIDVVIPESTDVDLEELAIEIGAEDCSVQNDEENSEFWQFKTDLLSFQLASQRIRDKEFTIIEQRTEFFPRTHSELTAVQFQEASQVVERLNAIEDATGIYDNISCKELDIVGSAIAY